MQWWSQTLSLVLLTTMLLTNSQFACMMCWVSSNWHVKEYAYLIIVAALEDAGWHSCTTAQTMILLLWNQKVLSCSAIFCWRCLCFFVEMLYSLCKPSGWILSKQKPWRLCSWRLKSSAIIHPPPVWSIPWFAVSGLHTSQTLSCRCEAMHNVQPVGMHVLFSWLPPSLPSFRVVEC